MKKVMYTENQKKIIANRSALEYMYYVSVYGLCDPFEGKVEVIANKLLAEIITDCAERRQRQKETFDKCPTLSNMFGRV